MHTLFFVRKNNSFFNFNSFNLPIVEAWQLKMRDNESIIISFLWRDKFIREKLEKILWPR